MASATTLHLGCTVSLLLAACATPAPPPPATAAAAAHEAAVPAAAAPQAGSEVDPNLAGTWDEFWAVHGRADTQRYQLSADGRFEWLAPRGSNEAVARRFGRYVVERADHALVLVLQVQGHEERFGCEGSAACRVTHDPPLQERLALGPCPPNEEAKAVDPGYRCISLDGHAFWRKEGL